MRCDEYYATLTREQKDAYDASLVRADELGIDLSPVDPIDIWYLVPCTIRGEKPTAKTEQIKTP